MDGEAQNALVGALSTLSEREKLVVIGLFVRGDSFRTLAGKMNCSPRTITRLKASSLEKMALALQDEAESSLTSVAPDNSVLGPTPYLRVPWAECRVCASQRIVLDEDGRCSICGPVFEATRWRRPVLGRIEPASILNKGRAAGSMAQRHHLDSAVMNDGGCGLNPYANGTDHAGIWAWQPQGYQGWGEFFYHNQH